MARHVPRANDGGANMSSDAHTVKRVLIVEDDDVFRVSLRATLAAQGYAVLAVDTAEAAETVLESEAVDVVLSDLRLPGMSGAALAARHPAFPFVLMTGWPHGDGSVRPLPPSVMASLIKPLDVPQLLVVLGDALRARARDAQAESDGGQHPAVNPH